MALLGATALAGALSLAISPATAQAFDQREIQFDLPAQPLASALRAYGATADQQLIFADADVRGRTAPALKGSYTSDEALNLLLAGANLTVRRTVSGVVQIASASDPQSGSAAGDGADSGTVQALIVTAQKREEDIQDVPIAISAFTQEDLTRSQVAGGPDLMTQVPNMTFTKTNFSSYSIQIRGIGTQAISATTDPAVAVAFNNTPFVRNRFFEQEFYDLQRIEVLRGPQGTLYGRNATAGVVNIISQKPKFTYEAKLSADVANYNSTRLEGMINLPLVEDKVALRLAGAWTKRDGYVTNSNTGQQIDGRDLWSTRLSLRVAPTDRIEANLIWEHFNEGDDRLRSGKQLCKRDDRTEIAGHPLQQDNNAAGGVLQFNQGCLPVSMYSPQAFEAPNGNSLPYFHPLFFFGLPIHENADPYVSTTQSRDLRVIESTTEPKYTAKSDLVELQMNFDVSDHLTLTSETAYNYDELFSLQDFNRFNTTPGAFMQPEDRPNDREGLLQHGEFGGIYCDPQLGCADRLMGNDLSTARSRQFSQELRLGSDFDGPFNFSLGANFLRYDTEDKYYVFINTLGAVTANMGDRSVPWIQGVSDNHECLAAQLPPDASVAYNLFSSNTCMYIDPNPIGSLNDQGHNYFLSRNPYKLISYAVFGEAYYNITDNLKVTAGLRWTVDKKAAPRIPSALLVPRTRGLTVEEVVKQEWREPTGRLAIDWKPDLSFTEETLLYASYAHGYKAGGMNPPLPNTVFWGNDGDPVSVAALAGSLTKPKTFAPEFVDAFELGAKNTLLDGKLTLNIASFYYNYKDYQISQIIDRSAVNSNFDARVWGLELEADWRPLENLKLGQKLGYENTRVADGEKAIDIMDRTAGNPDWVVARPFPTFTENCILPLYVVSRGVDDQLQMPFGSDGSGFMGSCEFAYLLGLDPVTLMPYVPNPTLFDYPGAPPPIPLNRPGYPGFNPLDPRWNHGEGLFKDLSGNALPNAPHYTATLTADYTIPLPNDWFATLHTDLYYQSEAWTRIFNMPGYDKLKAYTNINLAAIFTNEDAGWKVMAYIKNVMDRDSITGAFLFSDDVGLTTNVFLTEPRLYGLRVTKDFTGGPWWTGANPNHPAGEPYPLTVEVSGDLMRANASRDPVAPASITPEGSEVTDRMPFANSINPYFAQNRDLDRSEGKNIKLTWRPNGSPWFVSGDARFGKAKAVDNLDGHAAGDEKYIFTPITAYNWIRGNVTNKEEYALADFSVGRDVGLGWGVDSHVEGGLRYADFQSSTRLKTNGVTDWDLGLGFYGMYSTHHFYDTDLTADREFKGAGPALSWDAATTLLGDKQSGRFDLDWSVTGGVLFGKQKSSVAGHETATYYYGKYAGPTGYQPTPTGAPVATAGPVARSKSVTVPFASATLGLSYQVQRFKIGAGYRWERYFNVLDAGYDQRREVDRTMDGPYFKIAVGFGG
jgi:outer membrane receptor protein involved in Fe transport